MQTRALVALGIKHQKTFYCRDFSYRADILLFCRSKQILARADQTASRVETRREAGVALKP